MESFLQCNLQLLLPIYYQDFFEKERHTFAGFLFGVGLFTGIHDLLLEKTWFVVYFRRGMLSSRVGH